MFRFVVVVCSVLFFISPASSQTRSPDESDGQLVKNRAVEAVIWGMPAVNYDLMLQEMLEETGGPPTLAEKRWVESVFSGGSRPFPRRRKAR